jgi:hypothetical protein
LSFNFKIIVSQLVYLGISQNRVDFDFDFKILTALKGWVGYAPQGRGALHNYPHCANNLFQVE